MDDAPGDVIAEELTTLLTSWMRDLRDDRSPHTLETYKASVTAFIAYIRTAPDAPADLDGITRWHVRDWVQALKDSGRAPGTRKTRFTNLRTFFSWLVKEGELPESPMKGMEEPKVVEQPVPVLSVDAIKAMIDTCKGRDFVSVRDEAIIRALADAGPRRAELGKLEVADVDMDQEVFWVRGKGGKDRAVPFGVKTARAVDRYLRARRKHKAARTTDRLWLGVHGAFGPEGIRRMIAARAEGAGLGHVYPHQLRHTAAHQLRLAGMNDQDMKRIFGWGKNSRQLDRYGASAADERAREAHRRYSFGDQL